MLVPILLPSYNDPSKKQAFSYTIENGQLHLQTGLVSDDNIPYDSLEQFDGMTLLKNATPEDYASIEESADVFGYRTTNNLITQAFSKLMGLENDWYSGAIAGVDFLYFTEEELEFQLIKHDETGSSYVNVENGHGTFTEIGTTIDPVLEDYISTFSYPSKNLGDQVSNIVQDNLSTSSVLKMVSIQTGQVLSQRSTAVDYDANNLQMLFTDPSSLTENVFVKNVDGKAHRVFIDAQTYQLTEEEVAPTWKELGWVKDSFDFAAFKNDGGNTYTYYGSLANEIVYNLSQINFDPKIDTLTLEVSGQKVKSLKAVSDALITTDNQPVRYELDIVLEDTPRAITQPALTYEYETYAADAFSNLTSGSLSYKAVATNDLYAEGNKMTTIVNPDLVYFEDTIVSAFGNSLSQTGYYKTAQGWTKFKIENGAAVALNRPSPALQFKEMIGLNLYDYSFNYNKEKTELSPVPYLKNASKYIPYKLAEEGEVSDHTIRMKASDNRISEITYDVSSQGYFGKETVQFTYAPQGQTTAVDPNVMTLLENMPLDFKEPTNWKEENESIYNNLVKLYGDAQIADAVPYLYVPELSGYWDGYFSGTTVMLFADGASYDSKKFYDEFTKKLADLGFQIGKDEFDNDIYYKGNIGVLTGPTSLYITFKIYTPTN